jgi:site-specific DNA recombinase
VRKSEGQDARYEVLEEEANVVRRIFHWYTVDQLSMWSIRKKLMEEGIQTKTGLAQWCQTAIWGLLRNPAYAGKACYGKWEHVHRVSTNRIARTTGKISRQLKSSSRQKPREEWITLEVPAIVTETTFEAAQEQLQRNKRFAERNRKGNQYLLRGLLVCKRCAYALYGRPVSGKNRNGGVRRYAYYRCTGMDGSRFADGPVCDNKQVPANELDAAIWENVCEVLNEPERLLKEFSRRQAADGLDLGMMKNQRDALIRSKKKAEVSIQRLVDAYEAGVIEVEELKLRTTRLREKMRLLDEPIQQSEQAIAGTLELTEVLTRLSEFKTRLSHGLDKMDFDERSKLVRTLVERVEVDRDDIHVVYRVGAGHG